MTASAGAAKKGPPLMLIGVGVLIFLVVVGWLLFGLSAGGVIGSEEAPAPAVVKPDPKATLMNQGQALQVAELTISSAPAPAFNTKPTGLTASTTATPFTLSMDIKCAAIPTELSQVIGMGPHPGFPGVWFHPSYPGKLMAHLNDKTIALPVDKIPPVNTYFNFTLVYSPTSGAAIYLNGLPAAADPSITTLKWPADVSDWRWNQQVKSAPDLKVKNVYWFNSALSASDVAVLTAPSAPTTTTSTYSIQPYNLE